MATKEYLVEVIEVSATIKEIAAVAEVSRGTVDRVLNNRGRVNPEVAQRVKKIAEALGYKPNSAAKALATLKKRMVFGVLLPSVNNPFFIDVIKGIYEAQEELADFAVKVILKEISGYEIENQLQAIDELLAEDISALAILPIDDVKIAQKIEAVVHLGIPVVTINSDIKNSLRSCYVGIDFAKSGKLAAGLMGLINERANVLILTGSSKLLSHNQRVQGFNEVISKRYPNVKIAETLVCNDNNFIAYDLVLQALGAHPEIDALFIAAGGIKGACEAISRYPDRKISVICFDDIPHIKNLIEEGKISATICQQPFEQGYETISRMFRFFTEQDQSSPESILMDSIIKINENI